MSILGSAASLFLNFNGDNPISMSIKKLDSLDYKKQKQTQEDFAKVYLSKFQNKKYAVKKFNYFTLYKNNVHIVPSNLGIEFPGYLATTKERRSIFPLKTFAQGDEVTVLDSGIQPNDDFSLYADKILVKIAYNNQTLNIPLPTFEILFIAEDIKVSPPLALDYPKNFKFCDSVSLDNRDYTIADMNSNQELLKEKMPSLKDMGELSLSENGTYCFDTSVTDLSSEISLVMNQSFIFQKRVDDNE